VIFGTKIRYLEGPYKPSNVENDLWVRKVIKHKEGGKRKKVFRFSG
jgi:hypothetical protein